MVKASTTIYEGGTVSQPVVLDTDRNCLAADADRIEALRTQRVAVADLFKVLRGSRAADS